MTETNSKKNRFFSENNNQFNNKSLSIRTRTNEEKESSRSRDNSSTNSLFKFGGIFKPKSTMNKTKTQHEWDTPEVQERKDSDNFVHLPTFEYDENTAQKYQKTATKTSFGFADPKRKKTLRRKSFDPITQNEFKKMKRESKPIDLKFGRNMKYLLDFENKPHKMILSKEYRNHIWRFLLLSHNVLDDNQQGKLWLLASGAVNLINMEHNRNYYIFLRDHNMEYPNPGFNQIELDLRRTFPNDPADQMEKYIIPLRNVLSTFVKRNPTIGYCQGMNFIVGNLLKYLNEEQSFWVFVSMTENILPIDYYSDMLGILVDQKVFEHILTEKFPKLVAHMQSNFYQLDLIAFQWLVTLFFNSLMHETEKFILTAFLLKGQKIIIKIALLIIDYFKDDVMKATAFDQIYTIISKNPYEKITSEVLRQKLKDNKKIKLTNSMLKTYREKVRKEIIENLQENHWNSLKHNQTNFNKRFKFLNQFYLFNGLNKYYEHVIKVMNRGIITNDKAYNDALQCLSIMNSNLDNREGELMKVYNCNTDWPICLYDFTYKNKSNEYQTMRCRQKLSRYVVEDYVSLPPNNKKQRDIMIKSRQLNEDQTDVIREQTVHMCQGQARINNQIVQNFVRNFKILYIKGDDLLFKNPNLQFMLDNENDIIKKKVDFILELSGEKSPNLLLVLNEQDSRSYVDQEEYLAMKNNTNRGVNLKKNIVEDTFGENQKEDDFGFKDLGSVCVSKRFKPTITDLKLLIGTKEWEIIKVSEGIDENTVDELEPVRKFDQQGSNDNFQDIKFDQQSNGSLKNSSSHMSEKGNLYMMGGIQKYVMQQLIQSVAEKNDYDTSRINIFPRQSVVFGNEFENIQNDYTEHFTDMRKKTLTSQEILKVKQGLNKTVNLQTQEKVSENSQEASEEENSDQSMVDYRINRQRVILTREELEDLNRELSKTGIEPVDMCELGRMTHGEAELLRQLSNKKSLEKTASSKRREEEKKLDDQLLSSDEEGRNESMEFNKDRKLSTSQKQIPINRHRKAIKKNSVNFIDDLLMKPPELKKSEDLSAVSDEQLKVNESQNQVKK